ncbi:glycosyltransferase [Pedobacter xixiisoli]|uniref:GNT-I family protein n=1 Tax=Pedobacter xixiisoli TaxID=1476464 RepID=A0A286A9U5_9SPHI|nr:glycosyltransferase [Pedobacter xixiisoli]SOD18652.1 GNT-I family protein [Pedobacter xixiisoli]
MELAPIVLFVYNRPQHTLKVLEALSKNPLAQQSALYIFADGAKPNATEEQLAKITETRQAIKSKDWCKEIHIVSQEKNIGLAASILSGVGKIIDKHGRVIVLEDDVEVSPYFLNYMNQALELYRDDEKAMHISSFVPVGIGAEKLPDTYFLRCMSCWGWATWARAWKKNVTDSNELYLRLKKEKAFNKFTMNNRLSVIKDLKLNIENKTKTWAVNWHASIFLHQGLCLYPKQALSAQIGLDASGMHCGNDDLKLFDVTLANTTNIYRVEVQENKYALKYFMRFLTLGNFKGYQAFRHWLRVHKAITLEKFERLK